MADDERPPLSSFEARPPLSSFEAQSEEPQPEPVKDWSEVPGRALSNLPSSAGNFLYNMAQPFVHPIATATALKNIGQGALQATGLLSGNEHVEDMQAIGHFLMNRYGSMDAFKNTLANDPVGVAGDLSMILSGGETAVARVPGIIGQAARVAGTAGRAINPVNAALQGARAVGRGADLIGSEGLGLMTGAGPTAIRTAAGAGYEGGQAGQEFLQNVRRGISTEDVVDDAKNALAHMRAQRGAEYRQGMANVGTDKTVLDFNDIDAAMRRANAVKMYKGQSLSPSTAGIRQDIQDTIDAWKRLDPAEYHTAEGFDALKQKIGDLRDATDFISPERKVANEAYGAVRQAIVNQVPEYARVMRGYEEASALTKEIERTLSLPKDSKTGPAVDTALRKLQSVLRNNVNTNYGRREELARYLINSGAPHLMEALAGQAMNSWMPRGLAQVAARLSVEGGAAALGFGAAGVPAAVAAAASLPFMSPRLMGEAAYKAGTFARPAKYVPGALKPAAIYGGTGASRIGQGNWLTDAHGRIYAGPQGPGTANAGEDQQNIPRPPGQQKGGRINAQHQRFADGGTPDDPLYSLEETQAAQHPALGNAIAGMATHMVDLAAAPGRTAAGQQPQIPGMWSDLDEAQAQANARGLQVGAPEAATMMMGSGTPFAMAEHGALGVTGGRMPSTLYHGTRSAEDIRLSGGIKPSNSGEFGPGVYLAPDPGTADFFASNVARGTEGPSIIPVTHALENPFYTTKQDWLEMLGGNKTPRQVQEQLKKQGYDGIVAEGLGGGGTQVVVFDPKLVTPSLTREKAPPLYSAVERAVADSKTPQAPAQQWLGTLKNAPGVKPEELETLGVEDFLKGQKGPVTKQALAEHIAENKVDVQEKMSGDHPDVQRMMDLDDRARHLEANGETDEAAQIRQQIRDIPPNPGFRPKFGQYTLPGGENYRELLLTLPTEASRNVANFVPPSQKDLAQTFRSSHWDEPNVLAHVRFDDRNIGGDKTLHMAEVQSDWHQKGRKQGYDSPVTVSKRELTPEEAHQAGFSSIQGINHTRYVAERNGRMIGVGDTEAEARRYAGTASPTVPDAPFKTTWPELALKRMIRYAAENGYDRISWDTGLTNAERYDLSKQVKNIDYTRKGEQTDLNIYTHDGQRIGKVAKTDNELSDLVGKEVADRIIKSEGKTRGEEGISQGTLSGLDLKVGGEGMKAFYDRMLPNVANKLVKKYGARVEQSSFHEGSPEMWEPFKIIEGQWGLRNKKDGYESSLTYPTKEAAHASLYEGKQHPAHSIKITPELRDQALHRGFPMFSTGIPIPPHSTDKRETQGYAKGGAVNGKATKAAAEYKTKGHPPRICANCQMFRPPSFCTAVKGQISPQAVCKFFEAKKRRASGGRIDASHTVRTGANSSADGTVFVDPRIPAKFRKFLAVHETTEQKHMAGGYARAHRIATAAERKAVEASGMDWKLYTHEMDGYLDHIEHERDTNPPKGKLHVSVGVALGHHRSGNK